jgi:hypothetical protein
LDFQNGRHEEDPEINAAKGLGAGGWSSTCGKARDLFILKSDSRRVIRCHETLRASAMRAMSFIVVYFANQSCT